jgi:hypothetical protein
MMKKVEKMRGICLLVSTLALVGLAACSDQNSAQPVAPKTENPSVSQQQEGTSTNYSSKISGAELAFQNLDVDRDQLISMAEAKANLGISSEFAIIDLDKDGGLNLNEFMVYAGEAPAAGVGNAMSEESKSE